jgi:hypothetical protein
MRMKRNLWAGLLTSVALVTMAVTPVPAQQQKPNILVIMADDIGYWNISAYNRGMMGYHTRPTSIASPTRVRFSPTIMDSNPAPRVALLSLLDRVRCGQGF